MINILYAMAIMLLMYSGAEAHAVHYQVENKGISARIFYAEDDPVSYSSYEIFGPGDKIPHQKEERTKTGLSHSCPTEKGTGS